MCRGFDHAYISLFRLGIPMQGLCFFCFCLVNLNPIRSLHVFFFNMEKTSWTIYDVWAASHYDILFYIYAASPCMGIFYAILEAAVHTHIYYTVLLFCPCTSRPMWMLLARAAAMSRAHTTTTQDMRFFMVLERNQKDPLVVLLNYESGTKFSRPGTT